jgi:phage gp36-like protein
MYATEQDIIDLYGDEQHLITFDRNNDGIADATAVAAALRRASNEIDIYVGRVYSLPLPTVPPVLVELCVDIALYYGVSNPALITEEKKDRYNNAISKLKDIAKGLADLGLQEEDEPVSQDGVMVSAPARIFGADTLENY